jgi:hypothetical protein
MLLWPVRVEVICVLVVRFPHGGFGTLVARQERFAKTNLEICEVLVDSDVTIKPV